MLFSMVKKMELVAINLRMWLNFGSTNGRIGGWLMQILLIGRYSKKCFLIVFFILKWENKTSLSSLISSKAIWVTKLGDYVPSMVSGSTKNMRKFVLGIFEMMVKECRTTMLIKVPFDNLWPTYWRWKSQRDGKRERIGDCDFFHSRLSGQGRP